PGTLEIMGHLTAENPEVDVFYGDGLCVDKDGLLQRSRSAHDFDFAVLLYYGIFIATNATFFRPRIFREGFLTDLDYRIVMDYEYFIRLAAAGKTFKYSKQFLSAFRWHGANLSLQHGRRRQERLRVQRSWSSLKLPDVGYDTLAQLLRTK